MPRFRADLGQLAGIRRYVTETAGALGVAPDAFDDLCLAVDEAVTNIILHGYGGAGDVHIDMAVENHDLVVRLRDQAPQFDPVSAAPDQLASPESHIEPGGFGLYLILKAVDGIEYRWVDACNELTMVKRDVVNRS